jgi:protein-tyrosine-phosphatase
LRSAGLISAQRSSADRRDTYYRLDLARCRDLFVGAGAALHPGLRLAWQPAAPGHTPTAPRVLFLCTGNSARSQIAEAMLQHRSGHVIDASSAGSHPKPLHANAVRVMAERGLDIAGRPTKHFGELAGTRFDHVITLCDKVREVCPDFPGGPTTAHWSIADPAAGYVDDDESYPAFVRTADEIETRVDFLIAHIAAEPPRGEEHP